MTTATFSKFLNQGAGVTGRQLGAIKILTFIQNGVELQFSLAADARTRYRNLKPLQWAGTESIWLKEGPVLGGKWRMHLNGPGTGSDNPEPANIVNKGNLIAYWDSPGPNVASFLGANPSQIYVVQNFTGWIVGDSIKGGTRGERLCEVAAWHSVVNIANSSWGAGGTVPTWQRVHGDRSGTGWVDPSVPPAL